MKNQTALPFIFVLVLSACSQNKSQSDLNKDSVSSQYQTVDMQQFASNSHEPKPQRPTVPDGSRENQVNSSRVWHPVKDPSTGVIDSHIPMPSDWKLMDVSKKDDPCILGPNGVKAYVYLGNTFYYSSDAFMQQSYQATGQAMKRPMGVEALVQSELIPPAVNSGMQVVNKYHLPALADFDRSYNAKLFRSVPTQSSFDAYVVEWKDKEGNPSLTFIRYNEHVSQAMIIWSYSINALEANPDYYEQAKEDYLFSLINTRVNEDKIAMFNAKEKAKSDQSWASFNNRMNQKQRNFNAQNQATTSSQNSVSDIMMDGWRSRNGIQEQGHSNYINSVTEQSTMVDPYSGQNYQVEAGSNQTWMNGNGEYIQSNDYFYDPNMDPNTNNNNWQEGIEYYGTP